MRALCFLDTNILIYAAAGKKDEPEKYVRATEIIRENDIVLSTQVIGEFLHVSRKKYLKVMGVAQINIWADSLFRYPTAMIDEAIIKSALFVAERYQISFWDAALVAAAERFNAKILYTEDLNNGQRYGSVTAINPFRTSR
jgi:predicted nucleic acid-binding protein